MGDGTEAQRGRKGGKNKRGREGVRGLAAVWRWGAAKRIVAMSAKEEKEQSARRDEGVAKGKGRERRKREREREESGPEETEIPGNL